MNNVAMHIKSQNINLTNSAVMIIDLDHFSLKIINTTALSLDFIEQSLLSLIDK